MLFRSLVHASIVEVTFFSILRSLRTPSLSRLALFQSHDDVPEAEGPTSDVLSAFDARFYFDASRASTCGYRHESMDRSNFPSI